MYGSAVLVPVADVCQYHVLLAKGVPDTERSLPAEQVGIPGACVKVAGAGFKRVPVNLTNGFVVTVELVFVAHADVPSTL